MSAPFPSSAVVITPPEQIVSLELAKKHLRVDHSDDDALISLLINAAQGGIDGPAGWLGCSVGLQTLRADFVTPWASYSALDLPFPPLVEVVSVEDLSGASPVAVDASTWVGSAAGLRSLALPTLRRFRVTYTAGYETPPAPIVAAVLMITADLYANREAQTAVASGVIQRNPAVEALLAPYRVWRV